jgi:hypothetical protein
MVEWGIIRMDTQPKPSSDHYNVGGQICSLGYALTKYVLLYSIYSVYVLVYVQCCNICSPIPCSCIMLQINM